MFFFSIIKFESFYCSLCVVIQSTNTKETIVVLVSEVLVFLAHFSSDCLKILT